MPGRKGLHLDAIETDMAAVGLGQSEDAAAERALAAAELAHQPKRAAALDGERDVVDAATRRRFHGSAARVAKVLLRLSTRSRSLIRGLRQ